MPGDDELLTALTVAMNTARPEQGALQAVGQLPAFVPIELQSFAIEVTRLAADGLRDQLVREPGIAPEVARTLHDLAHRLAEAGRREEAVPVSEEAVTRYRELAAADREAYLPYLALSLNNHALRLAETGRRDEAVPVSEEAVAAYRKLAAANRAAYLPGLAMSLVNHASRLFETGRRDEALRELEAAVAGYRELVAAD